MALFHPASDWAVGREHRRGPGIPRSNFLEGKQVAVPDMATASDPERNKITRDRSWEKHRTGVLWRDGTPGEVSASRIPPRAGRGRPHAKMGNGVKRRDGWGAGSVDVRRVPPASPHRGGRGHRGGGGANRGRDTYYVCSEKKTWRELEKHRHNWAELGGLSTRYGEARSRTHIEIRLGGVT